MTGIGCVYLWARDRVVISLTSLSDVEIGIWSSSSSSSSSMSSSFLPFSFSQLIYDGFKVWSWTILLPNAFSTDLAVPRSEKLVSTVRTVVKHASKERVVLWSIASDRDVREALLVLLLLLLLFVSDDFASVDQTVFLSPELVPENRVLLCAVLRSRDVLISRPLSLVFVNPNSPYSCSVVDLFDFSWSKALWSMAGCSAVDWSMSMVAIEEVTVDWLKVLVVFRSESDVAQAISDR
mmetsp:Transcript_5192/g.9962  ORF Transcript_5192/g.9962 Transcript_5192/m.9962 type:complete len:237 (+) Transcript_5192:141-851(+)